MAQRDEIIEFCNSYLDVAKFTDYAPIGLQVEGKGEVRRIATAVSACMEVFEAAAAWNADMVMVHHGMFWERDDRVLRGHLKQRVQFLLEHDMTLAGYHLPLDAHPETGNNALFAKGMGFRNRQPFGLYHGMNIGWRGGIEPIPLAEFIARAAEVYQTPAESIRVFGEGKPIVSSAAIVSGGAWDMMSEAVLAGVDCYVTGNADEPVYHLAKENRIHFLSMGHHVTERVGIRALGSLIADRFRIDVKFFDVQNPL